MATATPGSKGSGKGAPDPRFRPFRIGAYGFYLAVVSAFSLLVIWSVVGSVMKMTPGRRPSAEPTLTPVECLQRAEALFQELESERARLTSTFPASRTDDNWVKFRVSWEERYRDAESHCALESRAHQSLREVYEKLSRVMDLFTTSSVQYAGEAGPGVDEFRASLEAARKPSP